MAQVIYDRSSPYFGTGTFGKFLDISTFPAIPKQPDDVRFQVNKTYQYRPDLLAYDLYGDVKIMVGICTEKSQHHTRSGV